MIVKDGRRSRRGPRRRADPRRPAPRRDLRLAGNRRRSDLLHDRGGPLLRWAPKARLRRAAATPPTRRKRRPRRGASRRQAAPACRRDVQIRPGESVAFRVRGFRRHGASARARSRPHWSPEWPRRRRRRPELDDPRRGGVARPDSSSRRAGELEASARVRVRGADLPLAEDFETVEPGERPGYQLGYGARFEVAEYEGGRVLAKGPSPVADPPAHHLLRQPRPDGLHHRSRRQGRRRGSEGARTWA